METFKLDDRVKVIGKNVKGIIAYIGKTHLSDGIMYGIVLDKPKGRCDGTVGGVRYFMCPEGHGVFVRACQLEMYSGNSSCDCDDYNDVVPRPAYPNYLKYSSKLNFRKSKYNTKSKEHVIFRNSPSNDDTLKRQTSVDKMRHGTELKMKKPQQSSKKRAQKRITVDEEFRFLAEKINAQTQQIDTIRRHMKKLKTYLKWCRGFNLQEKQMKKVLDNAIDGVIRNLEDVIGKNELGEVHDRYTHDTELEQENTLLLQCIFDLEKKNETLVECVTKIRSLLLKSYESRSHSKSKNSATRKETIGRRHSSGNKNNNDSLKISESHSMSNFPTRNQQLLNDASHKHDEGKRETEKIKRFLESLQHDAKNKSQSRSSSVSRSKKERIKDNSQGDSQESSKTACVKSYLQTLNQEIKELNNKLCDMQDEKADNKHDEKLKSKSSLISEKSKSSILKEYRNESPNFKHQSLQPPKGNTRHQPYDLDKRVKLKPIVETMDSVGVDNNPLQELVDLISSITNQISLNDQIATAPKDSTKFKEPTKSLSETSLIASECYSNRASDKFDIKSNSSSKTKSENNLKLSRSTIVAKKKQKPSPKRRTPLKPAIEARK